MPQLKLVDDPEYQRLRKYWIKSLDDITGYALRALLDTVSQSLPKDSSAAGHIRKRLHNDIPMIKAALMAAFIVVENGGEVPSFGNPNHEEGHGDAHAKRQGEARKAS